MSYILDALKKSEQERGQGKIPDVQTIHSSSLAYRRDRKAWWPYVLITAIVLNLAAIVYFNLDRAPDPATGSVPDTAEIATEARTEDTVSTPPATLPAAAEPAPVQQTEVPAQQAANDKAPGAEPAARREDDKPSSEAVIASPAEKPREKAAPAAATETPDKIADYNELPESFRQQLPVIKVTAHVYSSNPQQRSVVINNNFMEEGEYVLDGLVLYEITRTGVIFSYHDTLFHYNVVSGWQ